MDCLKAKSKIGDCAAALKDILDMIEAEECCCCNSNLINNVKTQAVNSVKQKIKLNRNSTDLLIRIYNVFGTSIFEGTTTALSNSLEVPYFFFRNNLRRLGKSGAVFVIENKEPHVARLIHFSARVTEVGQQYLRELTSDYE
jgi:hypothetical protein